MSLPDTHPSFGARQFTGARELPGAGGGSRFGAMMLLGVGVLTVLGGGGLAVLFFLFALFGDPPDKGFAIGLAVVLGVGAVGVGGVLAGIGFMWRRKLQSATPTQQAIAVYERGVAFLTGDDRTELAWSEVDGFICPPSKSPVYGMQISVPYAFFVVMGKGKRFEARSMAHIKEMGNAIEQATAPLRMKAALARLDAGQPVTFGSVVVTPDGLRGFGIGSITWSDLQGLGVGRMNRLVAKERGVPVGQKGPFFIETPDVGVLFALVGHMRQRTGG